MVYNILKLTQTALLRPNFVLVPSTPVFLPKYHCGHNLILLTKQLLLLYRTALQSSSRGPEHTEVV